MDNLYIRSFTVQYSGQDPVMFTVANVRRVYMHLNAKKKRRADSDAHLSTVMF